MEIRYPAVLACGSDPRLDPANQPGRFFDDEAEGYDMWLHGFPLRRRLDKATLYRLYVRDGLSTTMIGERFGTQGAAVRTLLAKYEIPKRLKRRSLPRKV